MTPTPKRLPSRRVLRFSLAAVLAFAVLALPVPGADSGAATIAKKQKITGTLSKPGYTVIALASSGEARSDRAGKGKFAVRAPAKHVTLHLRAKDGTYAGPVVVGSKKGGKKGVLGLNAGAKLGKVKVKTEEGYAKPAKKPAKKWVDSDRVASAEQGVPIGAGNFGLVKSKKSEGGSDGDLDGVPDPLDVDDDGDLILDDYDRKAKGGGSKGRSSRAGGGPEVDFQLATSLGGVGFKDFSAVNVNGGSTDAEVAAQQQELGTLNVLWSGLDRNSGELDCGGGPDPEDPAGWIGGLGYCTRGGTGLWLPPGMIDPDLGPRGVGRPLFDCSDGCGGGGDDLDSDGDGLASLTPTISMDDGTDLMTISHGATSDEIRTGDILIGRGTADGQTQEAAASVGFVFATHPVVAGFSDGQGNSATYDYPLPPGQCGSGGACAEPVQAAPGGDLKLELDFWRPQRRGVEGGIGETEWMDVGHLAYAIVVRDYPDGSRSDVCPQSSYSALDPDLKPLPAGIPLPANLPSQRALEDTSDDQPVNEQDPFGNAFSLTLNLTRCYEALGFSIPPVLPLQVEAVPMPSGSSREGAFVTSQVSFEVQP